MTFTVGKKKSVQAESIIGTLVLRLQFRRMFINLELNCGCFRLTGVIRSMRVQNVHSNVHNQKDTAMTVYICKTNPLIIPNLNNTARVFIIDSCGPCAKAMKNLPLGAEKDVSFSVHEMLAGFSSFFFLATQIKEAAGVKRGRKCCFAQGDLCGCIQRGGSERSKL